MDGPLYMDAEIRPNRSLSQRGFVTLIGIVTVMNCASAAVFLAMGAYFVPMFLGLDLIAITLAFLASFAAAKRVQRVRVTAAQVEVSLETPKESRLVWNSPTAFTRVSVLTEDDGEDGTVVDVRLALSGKEVQVAQALSPPERAEFAQALQKAILQARTGALPL